MRLITARKLDDVDMIGVLWLEAARAEAREYNPLNGYVSRVYFERTKRIRRKGKRKGTVRRRRTMEVELMKILPSGRCVTVKDIDTPELDALVSECLANTYIPPDTDPRQVFLNYFRKL